MVFQSLAVDRRAFGVDLGFVAHWVVDHLAVEGGVLGVAELVPESGLRAVVDGVGGGRGHPLERLDFVEVDAFAGVGEGEAQRPRGCRPSSFSGLRIHRVSILSLRSADSGVRVGLGKVAPRGVGVELNRDAILADGAERLAERSHLAVELGAVGAAVIVEGSGEGADRPRSHRARLRVALRAVGVDGRGEGGGGADEGAPLEGVAVDVRGHVRLRRLGAGVVIMAGLARAAATVVLVLVGQTEGGVAKLVDADLEGPDGAREDGDRPARAAVGGRVDDHQDAVPVRHLGVHHLAHQGAVAAQEARQVVPAEGGIKVGGGAGARAAAGAAGRVLGAAVRRGDVHPIDVEPGLVRVERGRQEEIVHEVLGVGGKRRQLGLLVALADDHQVEAFLAAVLENGGADDGAVALAHATPPSVGLIARLKVANSAAASPSVSGLSGLLKSAIWVAVSSAGASRSKVSA